MALSGWLSLVLQIVFAAILVQLAQRREILALNSESISEMLSKIMLKNRAKEKIMVSEAVRELGSAADFKT